MKGEDERGDIFVRRWGGEGEVGGKWEGGSFAIIWVDEGGEGVDVWAGGCSGKGRELEWWGEEGGGGEHEGVAQV